MVKKGKDRYGCEVGITSLAYSSIVCCVIRRWMDEERPSGTQCPTLSLFGANE
jgi:hypothetical protein